MPYVAEGHIGTPSDEVKLWRYMDFTKFVSILEDAAIYFPCITQMEDKLEGFLTAPSAEEMRKIMAEVTTEHTLEDFGFVREELYISCWHQNDYESAAMWRLYLKSNEGIAIQTTVERFKRSIASAADEVYLGEVRYVDFDKDHVGLSPVMLLALNKRKSYEHEREVRAVILDPDHKGPKKVPVNLSVLLEGVYVAPACGAWLHELVTKVLKRYGLSVPVTHSALDAKPIY